MDLIPRKFYLDDIFDDFMVGEKTNIGKCDIYEKDNKYHIEMDIPGFNKEDIKINIENNYLNVSAKKESKEEDKSKKYIRRERSYSKFERSIYLGDADTEDIEAKYENGILNIVVPKIEENNSKKYIEIK